MAAVRNPMKDVMVDLETTGNRAGCPIISIGAVLFDPIAYKLGDEFYKEVRLESCHAVGLVSSQDTLDWWAKQSPEASATYHRSHKNIRQNVPITKALESFTKFVHSHDMAGSHMRVWGNGSDFDNVILIEAYRLCGMQTPWKFWNGRCFRTLKNLRPEIKVPREGVHHNALDDAKHQAKHALEIFKVMSVR